MEWTETQATECCGGLFKGPAWVEWKDDEENDAKMYVVKRDGSKEPVSFDKILRKGLTDANPKVREAYRSTYWAFALIWPEKANA